MTGWLARRGWLLAIAIAYLFAFPYYPRIHSANELPRVYLVKSIVHDGTFAIDRGVARWGTTADVSPSRGHHYSNKAPGSSLLAVPVYAAVAAVAGEPGLAVSLWLCRVVTGVLPTLLLLGLLAGFLERFARTAVVRVVLVGYALGSMAMTYSVLYIAHQLAAVCLAAAWILALEAAERKRPAWVLAVAGFLAGASVLVEYQAAFAVLPIAVHVVWKLRAWPRRELARGIAIAMVAALVPIAVLLGYHAACFGSPLRTGYDASETFAGYHQQGFLGITALRWVAFRGSLLSADNGLLVLAPWWLLAVPGAVVLWRARQRDIVLVGAVVAVIYVLFVSSINFWRGGWSVGPRYITQMLPFLLPLVAAALDRMTARWWWFAAAAGAIAVGVAIYALATITFPHWPDSFRNPLYEVTLRLLGEGLVAPNPLRALGVPGWASALPYLALVAGLLGWAIARAAGWRAVVLAALLAAGVVVAYRAFPATPNADAIYARGVRPAVAGS